VQELQPYLHPKPSAGLRLFKSDRVVWQNTLEDPLDNDY
jgi:hypothetical protein